MGGAAKHKSIDTSTPDPLARWLSPSGFLPRCARRFRFRIRSTGLSQVGHNVGFFDVVHRFNEESPQGPLVTTAPNTHLPANALQKMGHSLGVGGLHQKHLKRLSRGNLLHEYFCLCPRHGGAKLEQSKELLFDIAAHARKPGRSFIPCCDAQQASAQEVRRVHSAFKWMLGRQHLIAARYKPTVRSPPCTRPATASPKVRSVLQSVKISSRTWALDAFRWPSYVPSMSSTPTAVVPVVPTA